MSLQYSHSLILDRVDFAPLAKQVVAFLEGLVTFGSAPEGATFKIGRLSGDIRTRFNPRPEKKLVDDDLNWLPPQFWRMPPKFSDCNSLKAAWFGDGRFGNATIVGRVPTVGLLKLNRHRKIAVFINSLSCE
jgi:hypothetical protein